MLDALIARAAARYVSGSPCRMRQRTSDLYGRRIDGSSMAAIWHVTVESVARTAETRSEVKVAMPHRRGTADDTNAIRRPTVFISAYSAPRARPVPAARATVLRLRPGGARRGTGGSSRSLRRGGGAGWR